MWSVAYGRDAAPFTAARERLAASGFGETVSDYQFSPNDLRVGERTPGISAFMRTKNGAEFVEATIRSHIPHIDELVVVFNRCTDSTPLILARLQAEFGPNRLRVYHYAPLVHAPGSIGHAREHPTSPSSFVNMSNFALTQTRHTVVMKLDDDHIAMQDRLLALSNRIRAAHHRLNDVLCFSGLNLAEDEAGRAGVLAGEPFSGNGDIGFFEVTPATHFVHNPRFEDFHHDGKRRSFADFAYWHMKYLKEGFGFANRDIDHGNARFARKRDVYLANRRVEAIADLVRRAPRRLDLLTRLPLPDKNRLRAARWRRLVDDGPSDLEAKAVLARTRLSRRNLND